MLGYVGLAHMLIAVYTVHRDEQVQFKGPAGEKGKASTGGCLDVLDTD